MGGEPWFVLGCSRRSLQIWCSFLSDNFRKRVGKERRNSDSFWGAYQCARPYGKEKDKNEGIKGKDIFEMTHSPVCLELRRDKARDGGRARLQDLASFCGLTAHCSLKDICHQALGESMWQQYGRGGGDWGDGAHQPATALSLLPSTLFCRPPLLMAPISSLLCLLLHSWGFLGFRSPSLLIPT